MFFLKRKNLWLCFVLAAALAGTNIFLCSVKVNDVSSRSLRIVEKGEYDSFTRSIAMDGRKSAGTTGKEVLILQAEDASGDRKKKEELLLAKTRKSPPYSIDVLPVVGGKNATTKQEAQTQQRPETSHKLTEIDNDDNTEKTAYLPPHVGYKKVLVTGGAGFIGSHVARYLLARGDDVVIVDQMNDYYDVRIKENNLRLLREAYPEKGRIAFYRADICDESSMTEIFESERPQWVCHMAARAGVRPSIRDPYAYIQSNIKGTTLVMELSHKYKVKNLVFASSSSVYGGSPSTVFSEKETVDHPLSPYGASKKACELLAYTYHHLYQLNVTALRFFTVYGPNGRPDMAPFKFIDRVSRGVEIQQFGDGSSSRDYTYISDIVDGIARAIDRPYKYEVFNLGKGNSTSLNAFIGIVEKHTGRKARRTVLPDQPGDAPYTHADVQKASRLLGYEPRVSLDEGIRLTVQWYNETRNNIQIDR